MNWGRCWKPNAWIVIWTALTAAAAIVDGPGQVAAQDTRPNIVFIFADDHAYQAISAYGSKLIQTPNIDRIAKEGMRFDRCLVTNSICGPSRAVVLTGKYSHVNGFRDNASRFDSSQDTFVKQLQQSGYQTAIFGKWHLESDPVGFDTWSVLPGQGRYYNPIFLGPDGKQTVDGYVTDVIADKALEWLRNTRQARKPFLLMVHQKAPHREWQPGPAHLNDFADDLPEPTTLFDDYHDRPDVIKDQAMMIARNMRMGFDLKYFTEGATDEKVRNQFFSSYTPEQRAIWEAAYNPRNRAFDKANLSGDALTRWKYQRFIKDYLRCIASVDDNIGRLLDELDALKLSENTVVVYSSDQGFYLGEHGWFDKRWIFEQSLRTPLLVRWPGVTEPGSTCNRIVSNLDFAETFLDIAHVQAYPGMQGRSLIPLLRQHVPEDWRKSFYYHYYETTVHSVPAHFGVVTDQHKLVCYYKSPKASGEKDINEWELLDLKADPEETHSFLNDAGYRQARQRLYAELVRLQTEVGDTEFQRTLPPEE